MKLQVDNELKKIIPPLTLEEFAILEKNILENGIQDSIKTWQGIIIDGHNRYEIACKHSILYDTKEIKFDNRQDVIEWMLNNQLGRRNLSAYDRSLIALKLEEMYKLNVKEKEKVRKINNDFGDISKVMKEKVDTRKEMAKKANVSDNTLNKVKHIEQKATPEVKKKLKKGEITINKAFQDIKKEERKRENEQKIKAAASKKNNSNIKILEGDLFDLIGEIEDNSIDLLCTDPPYFVLTEEWDTFKNKKDFLDFTENWLNAIIPKIKSNTGRIYISFAHDYIFDLYNIFLKNNFYGFNFFGQIVWVKKNNNQKFNRKAYRLTFEPILYLYGKDCENLNFEEFGEIQSNVWEIATPQSNFSEGKFHPTQKPLELYRRIISTSSNENDLVLDCFSGSGTTGIVCKQLNRKCILIEKDKNYIEIMKGRINDVG